MAPTTSRVIPLVAHDAHDAHEPPSRHPTRLDAARARLDLRSGAYALATEAIARAVRTPPYLIVFVSDKCWMKCSHCWFNEDWKEQHLRNEPLSFDEYRRLAQSIPRVAFLSITGGEAFHRADIAELATMFCKTTRVGRYQIPTSGYRVDKIVADTEVMLKSNPGVPLRIDVSLDGTRDVHNQIRRVRDGFEHALQTLAALTRLKARYAYFDVGVITTISHANQHVLPELAALVERVHDGEWMINIARGIGRDAMAVDVDPAAYRWAHEHVRGRIERGGFRGHSGHLAGTWLTAKNAARREIILDIIAGRREGGGCTAGSAAGVIQSDGTVKVCEMIDEPLGNLRDFDFDLRRIWQSGQARAMRRDIQASRCQCTQECFLSTSMLLSPDAWGRMLRARRQLQAAPQAVRAVDAT